MSQSKNKVRLFIVEIYSADCPNCGECFETGISKDEAEKGELIVCPECNSELEVEVIEDNL